MSFCGTLPEVSLAGRYPAPCSSELGLSSAGRPGRGHLPATRRHVRATSRSQASLVRIRHVQTRGSGGQPHLVQARAPGGYGLADGITQPWGSPPDQAAGRDATRRVRPVEVSTTSCLMLWIGSIAANSTTSWPRPTGRHDPTSSLEPRSGST